MKTLEKLTDSQRRELKEGVIEVTGVFMNRTALGVVDAIFTMYPLITYAELKQILPDKLNPSGPYTPKTIFKPHTKRDFGVVHSFDEIDRLFKEGNLTYETLFFLEEGEVFKTSDGVKVIVNKSWETKDLETGENDLQNLIDHVKSYGIRVIQVKKNKPFNKGKYNLEIINPTILHLLNGPMDPPKKQEKKKSPAWIILGLLFILLAIFIIWWNKKEEKKSNELTEVISPFVEEKGSITLETIKNQINAGESTKGQSVSFNEILFHKDSDEILTESENYLKDVLDILNQLPKLKLNIVGHTSLEGSKEHNNKLSQNRAIAVFNYLKLKGIEPTRLSTEGKGSIQPVASNDTEEGKKMNRRIEFIVLEDGNTNH